MGSGRNFTIQETKNFGTTLRENIMHITINRMAAFAAPVRTVLTPRRKQAAETVVSASAFRAVSVTPAARTVRSGGLAANRPANADDKPLATRHPTVSGRQMQSAPEGDFSRMNAFLRGGVIAGAAAVRSAAATAGIDAVRVTAANAMLAGQASPRAEDVASTASQRASAKLVAGTSVVANPSKPPVNCLPGTIIGCLPLSEIVRPSRPAGGQPAKPAKVRPSIHASASPPQQGVQPGPNANWKPGMPWIVIGDVVPLKDLFPPDVVISYTDCVPVPISSLFPPPPIAQVPAAGAASSTADCGTAENASPGTRVSVVPVPVPAIAGFKTLPTTVIAAAPPPVVVPGNDFHALRENDNVLQLTLGRSVTFKPEDVKILEREPDLLIGTDGDDRLDYMGSVLNDALRTGRPRFTRFIGGAGNDTINGGKSDDTMWGGSGNDSLRGNEGNDKLYGEEGDDRLDGGTGDDLLDGGGGNDELYGGLGNDRISGGDGDDHLHGYQVFGNVQQTLAEGQSDDDVMDGGAGNDYMNGGFGNDLMWGGTGDDSMQGGSGDDKLYGEEGNDKLYGEDGNDLLMGGEGDDVLYGDFMPTYASPRNDIGGDDLLYGGAGNDTLYGGAGNDLLDGGAGQDAMQGGKGDDTYVVDNIGDSVIEKAGEGHDTVIASCSYTLSANVEDLRLTEGGNFDAIGNACDNLLTGNSGDNLLDGGKGADTMIGGRGNDTYMVDDLGDQIVERAGEGIDTVISRIGYTLGDNLENLTLLGSSKPERETIRGTQVLTYGTPHYYDLEYIQGDDVAGYMGTCGETSVANVCRMAGMDVNEAIVVRRAIANGWCNTTADDPGKRGASGQYSQINMLHSFGLRADTRNGYDVQRLADLIREGHGVMLSVNAGKLWDVPEYVENGNVNHLVTVTGVSYDAGTGAVTGFYIADSGRGLVSDACRFLSLEELDKVANVYGSNIVYTLDPIKLRKQDVDAIGNDLDNVITGNRGNNLIRGGRGNDTLIGQAGNDTYVFSRGDGRDIIVDNDKTVGNLDVLQLTDVNQDNLWFSRAGSDLCIDVLGGNDRVTISDWYAGGATGTDNHIERIKTADGNTLYDTDVERLVQAMASFAPPPASQTRWSNGQPGQGMPLLTITH